MCVECRLRVAATKLYGFVNQHRDLAGRVEAQEIRVLVFATQQMVA